MSVPLTRMISVDGLTTEEPPVARPRWSLAEELIRCGLVACADLAFLVTAFGLLLIVGNDLLGWALAPIGLAGFAAIGWCRLGLRRDARRMTRA